jgi:GNAT superfamily N-acetyltransferase
METSIDIRELTTADVERIGDRLPLSRLDVCQTYLVAWENDEPIGHAHVAWTETKLGVPEIQDVFVPEHFRRRGIATALAFAAEAAAAERGHARISLGYGAANNAAQRLYERLGYRDAGLDPERVNGVITIRGRPVHVNDTIVYLVKEL